MGRLKHNPGTKHTAAAGHRTERLDYLQSMLGQLRVMAEGERCNMVAYLIGMAYIEVSDIIREERPHRIEHPDGSLPAREEKGNGTA